MSNVFLSVAVAFLLTLPGSHSKEVCIVPDGGGTQHLPSSCGSTSTVDQLCGGEGIQDDTVAAFIGGIHTLSKVCEIKDVKNVVFKTLNASEVSIHCSSHNETGLKSIGVSALTVSGLQFIGCGLPLNYSSDGLVVIVASLVFVNGSDLTLTNVTVSDPKLAGIYVYNVVGNVSVDSSTVSNASYNLIRYTSHIATTSQFTMSNCFIMNSRYPPLNFSGGVSLLVGNSKLKVKLVNNRLIRNQGYMGGNLHISFSDFVPVSILNSSFIEGRATLTGGGVNIIFNVNTTATTWDFKFLSIQNSTFLNNVAENAGGLSITWTKPLKSSPGGHANIEITDTTFDRNSLEKGYGGVALQVFVSDYLSAHWPTLFNVTLSRCLFTKHYPNTSYGYRNSQESSVISAVDVPYFGMDSVVVESNNCSAVMAINSNLIFHGTSKFSNNTAIRGGGFRLTNSKVSLTSKSNVTITDNFAYETGGGIVIEDLPSCFDKFSCFLKWWYGETSHTEVSLKISDNVASEGGDEIFGFINGCLRGPANLVLDLPNNSLSRPSLISSAPQLVCIGRPSEDQLCSTKMEIAVYPGQKATHFLHVAGDFKGSVAGTVSASAMSGAVIKDIEKSQSVGMLGKDITYTVYLSQVESMEKPYIKLQPVEFVCSTDDNGPSQIEVTFLDCPFGFHLTNNSCGALECQCDANSRSIVKCSIESQIITKEIFSWVGMISLDNKSYLASSNYCPLDYCKPFFLNIKSLPTGLDQDEQCQYNRTGILCGSCPEGVSMVLGSSECRKNCSNVWLLLIIPFALAGILLVLVIHSLNLTVTMGTVCGLIFYANVLQDYSVEFLSSKHHFIPVLTPILQVFLSWLNLDLGFSTCFYEGMEAVGKTILLFVFPAYILLISATIVLISSRSVFFTRLFGSNCIKNLSTLILLSYSKLLRVTFGIFSMKTIDVLEKSSSSIRWNLDGNIPYLEPRRHLFLFMVAVLVLLFLLSFTLYLLFIKYVYHLPNWFRAFSWITKLKPFFDTYIGPYKDKTRFWTGLLLFIRVILLIVRMLDYKNSTIPYGIVVTTCVFLLFLVIYLKGVYKKHGLNLLLCFFIVNICLVFLFNIYKDECKDSETSVCWVSVVSHLLVSSAFLAFLGIVAYHLYLKLSRCGWMKRLKLGHQNRVDADMGYEGLRGYDSAEHLNELIEKQ